MIDWDVQPLGQVSDRKLAKVLGCNKESVRRQRERRGIAPFVAVSATSLDEYSSADTIPGTTVPSTLRSLRPEMISTKPDAPDARVDALVDFCRKAPRDLGEICDALNCGPSVAQELVALAQERGSPVEVQGNRLAWNLRTEHSRGEYVAPIAKADDWYSFAVLGDTHYGSKQCREDFIGDFCDKAYAQGCRTFFQVGDLVDGEYRHGVRELRAHGLEEQADEAISMLPYAPDAVWYFIDGNHDETFSKAAGIVCGRYIEDRARRAGRNDLNFLGQRRGRVRLNSGHAYSPKVELWHPLKGPSYALSYHLQKRIASYEPGGKPDFLFAGHWHQWCYVSERGVHGVSCGTFQGEGSAFGNALGTPASLGSTIVRYSLTEHGTLRDVQIQRVSYFEQETWRDVKVVA